MKLRIHCAFPQAIIQEPLLYLIGRNFDVVPNVRGASISEEDGEMELELEGEKDELDKVLAYLKEKGVRVEEREEG